MCLRDDGANWSLQNGLYLSRSKLKFFKHNDMQDLKARLEEVRKEDKRKKKPLNRRFIVVEAIYQVCLFVPSKPSRIYIFVLEKISSTGLSSFSHICLYTNSNMKDCCEQNSGQMVPLDELVRLKEEYKFRILVDESNSLGVLGKTGRGISEHYNIPVYFWPNWHEFILHIQVLLWFTAVIVLFYIHEWSFCRWRSWTSSLLWWAMLWHPKEEFVLAAQRLSVIRFVWPFKKMQCA